MFIIESMIFSVVREKAFAYINTKIIDFFKNFSVFIRFFFFFAMATIYGNFFNQQAKAASVPFSNTLTPTITGSTAMALMYEDGVALVTDRVGFYGSTARLPNLTRHFQLNPNCLVAFSGDFADFQWLQNLLERRQLDLQFGGRMQYMKPKMVHSFLSSLFYQRRSKIDPLWNTVVVCGMQPVEFEANKFKPFLGVVDMRGIAYETEHLATGIGLLLLGQMLETRHSKPVGKKLSKEEAIQTLQSAMEVAIARTTKTGKKFDLTTIDARDGIVFREPITVVGKWDVADVCTGQYF